MKIDRRELIATLGPGLLLALMAAGVGLLFAATLEPAERAAFAAMLESRGALLLLAWLLLSGGLGALVRSAYRHWVASAARVAEQAGVLLSAEVQREIEPEGSAETRALAGVINQLARQRSALQGRCRRAGAAGQPGHRTGAQPACRADGRTDPERRGLQPGRPHPAVQQPRQAAVQGAVAGAATGRRRRADRHRPFHLRRVRPQPGGACAGKHPQPDGARRGQPVDAIRHRHARPASCCGCRWRRCRRARPRRTAPPTSGAS